MLLAAPTFAAGPSYLDRPDPALTPGAFDPAVTQANIQETICKPGYTATVRNVTDSEKQAVIARYRAKYPHWPATNVEIDHDGSLELGGSNDPLNLWPEHYSGPFGARVKDQVEDYLHREVCAGRILLKDAQEAITHDWISVYKSMPNPPKARKGK
ncbi:MAG: HNH endonuclease [Actinomycetota bacterium]|nr:HNH endonuclease [Actinomycetota bacterium]